MTLPDSLLDYLASVLPLGLDLRAYHISTPPSECPALFAPPPDQEDQPTLCQNHFIAFASTTSDLSEDEFLVYAIELFVYSTSEVTTVFVSKADTSGYLSFLKAPIGAPSVVRTLTTSILDYFVTTLRKTSSVVLTLFARAQNQYLFPGSSETAGKHLLDDRQLIKWWGRVIDPVVRSPNVKREATTQPKAYLVVPGCDRVETHAFFPPSTKQDPLDGRVWTNSYPVERLAPERPAPPRSLIPRFPDDPKQRFLDELDFREASPGGQWRSVKSLDDFWEMMQYRQECSAGKLVGFLWAFFDKTPTDQVETNGTSSEAGHVGESRTVEANLPTPAQSFTEAIHDSTPDPPSDSLQSTSLPDTPPSSSPPALDNDPTTLSPSHPPILTNFPPNLNGTLTHTAASYDTLLTHLLDTCDFSTPPLAATATKSWIDVATKLGQPATSISKSTDKSTSASASVSTWGRTITGRLPLPIPTPPVPSNSTPSTGSADATHPPPASTGATRASTAQPEKPVINILTNVRKKRKADAAALDAPPNAGAAADAKKRERTAPAKDAVA